MNNEKEIGKKDKIERMTDIASQQLDLQYKLFSSIDSKTIWLISFLVVIISIAINSYITHLDSLLTYSFILAMVSLGISIFNLIPIDFEAGVNPTKITKSFWNDDKKIDELNLDVLSNLNYATNKNKEILSRKVRLFRYSLLFMTLFLTSFILFLIFYYANIPNI